jgi:hypothetical protein
MRVLLIEAFHLIRKIAQPNRHAVGAEFCHFPVSSMILRVRDPRAHSRRALTGRREDEEEIGRAARAMLANHGANAEQEAQWRANNLLQCGVESQADRWRQIALAICEMEASRLPLRTPKDARTSL